MNDNRTTQDAVGTDEGDGRVREGTGGDEVAMVGGEFAEGGVVWVVVTAGGGTCAGDGVLVDVPWVVVGVRGRGGREVGPGEGRGGRRGVVGDVDLVGGVEGDGSEDGTRLGLGGGERKKRK